MRDCTAVMAINLSRSQHGCAGCPESSERDLDQSSALVPRPASTCRWLLCHFGPTGLTAKCTALGHPYSITNPRERATTSREVRSGSLRPALRYLGILATLVRFHKCLCTSSLKNHRASRGRPPIPTLQGTYTVEARLGLLSACVLVSRHVRSTCEPTSSPA